MNILLIEDDEQIADLVVSAFDVAGVKTQVEKDGFRGLRTALQLNFDAILLDVALPLMDGFQVLEEIRRNSLSTPVIMLTASIDLPDRLKSFEKGADDYLPKPFDLPDLMKRSARALEQKRRAPAKPKWRLVVASSLSADEVEAWKEFLEVTPAGQLPWRN